MKSGKNIILHNYQQKNKEKNVGIDSFGDSTKGGNYYCQHDQMDTVAYTIERLYEILNLDFPPESVEIIAGMPKDKEHWPIDLPSED